MKNKLIRTSTIPLSLSLLLKGQLKYLNQFYEIIGVSSEDEDLHIVQEREGIRVEAINIERKISLISDLISLFSLYKFFRKEKPMIVHSITPKAGLLSMIASKLAGVPIRMHTFTGLIFPYRQGIMQKILIYMDKLLCSCATNIYPEGNGVKNDLINFKITTKPLKILANGNVNGIDTSYFNPELFDSFQKTKKRNELNINEDDFVFIFVGRLVKDKGINELVEAFNSISNCKEHVKLLLVGPLENKLDPLKITTMQLIEFNRNIISVGFQADIRPFLSISNALVFPSYREGFPNVVIQAGAMGLPSIVTNISGCNEIIIDKQNGTIIPPQEVEELKEKMELYIEDNAFLLNLSNNARKMIQSRYEQNTVWEALLKEYKRLEQEINNV